MVNVVRGFVPKITSKVTPLVLINSGNLGRPPVIAYDIDRSALLMSESHARKGSGWTGGGNFLAVKQTIKNTIGDRFTAERYGITFSSKVGYALNQEQSPNLDAQLGPLPLWEDVAPEAIAWGATAWRRSRPDKPIATVTQFLYEFTNLPTLPLRLLNRAKAFHALGDEYLNVSFGWIPFVQDLQKMYGLYRTLDQRLAQLRRDNGRNVRRRLTLKDTRSYEVVRNDTVDGSFAGFTPGINWPWGTTRLVRTYTTTERVWSSISLKYYIPDTSSSAWTRRATLALFGAIPTPETILSIMPWSWLVSWFSNINDIMSNISVGAVDGLTSDYAFIMREVTSSLDDVAITHCYPSYYESDSWGGGSFVSGCRRETTTKCRVRASPYGFGVTWDALTPYQIGIAAALGISRSRF